MRKEESWGLPDSGIEAIGERERERRSRIGQIALGKYVGTIAGRNQ